MRKCLILKVKLKRSGKILRQSHLEIGNISRDYSDDYPENKIIKTKPKQGERVNQHEKVDIVLSKGLNVLKCLML